MPLKPSHRRSLEEARRMLEDGLALRDETIEAAYEAGASLREISEVVGISHVGVQRVLKRRGVMRRPEY